ncbi:MAG: nucleotidyl transferase AbiEii/AbiGii toxin family protein [Armatimonadota bacterium]
MDTTKAFIKNLINESASKNELFKRNIVKEYLQVIVLDFIYSDPQLSRLLFYGGSCLAHCFGLPRLSEDLDFVDIKGEIEVSKLAKDLEIYFKKNTDLKLISTVQKFRIYLKFSILHELGLSDKSETDQLFLKVEVFTPPVFCKKFKVETIPLFKYNKSILIRTFDFSTLMATKIRAILHRKWEKTDKTGKTIAKVKGRDYFDLMWYLEKGVKPNMDCIEGIKSKIQLKESLLGIIKKVDPKSIQLDLESFIADEKFAGSLSREIKDILIRDINKL